MGTERERERNGNGNGNISWAYGPTGERTTSDGPVNGKRTASNGRVNKKTDSVGRTCQQETDNVGRTCQQENGQRRTDVSTGNGRRWTSVARHEEIKETEEMKETATSLIFRIGYKRLHERERRREQYAAESPPLIHNAHTRMRTHNHPTHMCTHTDFSHATEPRMDTPSKAGAVQNQVLSQPMNPRL